MRRTSASTTTGNCSSVLCLCCCRCCLQVCEQLECNGLCCRFCCCRRIMSSPPLSHFLSLSLHHPRIAAPRLPASPRGSATAVVAAPAVSHSSCCCCRRHLCLPHPLPRHSPLPSSPPSRQSGRQRRSLHVLVPVHSLVHVRVGGRVRHVSSRCCQHGAVREREGVSLAGESKSTQVRVHAHLAQPLTRPRLHHRCASLLLLLVLLPAPQHASHHVRDGLHAGLELMRMQMRVRV